MSIFGLFKKDPPKQNTERTYSSAASNKHKLYTTYVHAYGILPNDPSIFVEYENGEIVSKLRFSISNNELKICDFLAGGEDKDYHHGTELIIALMKHFNHPFSKIHGVLSPVDAYNHNWTKSIPFYADLPRHLFSKMGLRYEFSLFDDEHYKVNVTEILSSANREEAIEQYRMNHLYDNEGKDKKRFGSFHYILL